MPSLSDIIKALEARVNPGFQESWDNSGWQVTPSGTGCECSGVMVAVDVTDAVITEATARGCNLIVSHHPLIFKPLRGLTGRTPSQRMAVRLIKEEIAVYSAHTSLDSMPGGVSAFLAAELGLSDVEVLVGRDDTLLKVVTFVPHSHVGNVMDAIFAAGAGHIGSYDRCSFMAEGRGTFRPVEGSNPYVGNYGEDHTEPEIRLEAILRRHDRSAVDQALRAAHPYEEPAIDYISLELTDRSAGLGATGTLPTPLTETEFTELVKSVYGSPVVRTTAFQPGRTIKRVALCGGSGGEFIGAAIAAGADAYVTSDVRYHDFVDYTGRILVVDTGHFESEKCTKELLARIISEKFPNFAVCKSESEENPIQYH